MEILLKNKIFPSKIQKYFHLFVLKESNKFLISNVHLISDKRRKAQQELY
jgi:hypothetical protein